MMPTLSQRLRFFPTESRAIIFPQCRQDCPFLPFINRGGFHGLREETIGSKFDQKPAIFPFFYAIFLSFLSLSLHCGLRPPPFQPLSFRHRLHYQWSSELLTSSKAYTADPSLSLADFLLLLSSCSAT